MLSWGWLCCLNIFFHYLFSACSSCQCCSLLNIFKPHLLFTCFRNTGCLYRIAFDNCLHIPALFRTAWCWMCKSVASVTFFLETIFLITVYFWNSFRCYFFTFTRVTLLEGSFYFFLSKVWGLLLLLPKYWSTVLWTSLDLINCVILNLHTCCKQSY